MFKFRPHKLVGNELGHGTFGVVHPYRKDMKDNRWVVKSLNAKSTEEVEAFIQPIVLGSNHSHPNILSIQGYHIQNEQWAKRIFLKMPRMKESLKDKINRYKKIDFIPLEEIVSHFYDAVKGLEYLESRRIAHQDLKPSNILLDDQGVAKLSDIGMVRGANSFYTAPEISVRARSLKKRELHQGDVWSLGIVILELCLLEPEPIMTRFNSKEIQEHIQENLLQLQEIYGKELHDILGRMLVLDPEKRISFKEIRELLEKKFEDLYIGEEFENIEEEIQKPIKQEEESKVEEPSRSRVFSSYVIRIDEGRQTSEDQLEDNLESIKDELNEKWKQFFLFKNNEQWSIVTQDKKKLNDIEVEIFLFDISERLKNQDTLKIEQVKLDLSNCVRISNKGLTDFGVNIAQYFVSARELALNLNGCDQLTDDGIIKTIGCIANNLTELETLVLDFSYLINCSDNGFSQVADHISSNLINLRHLKMIWNYTNISDKSVRFLISRLSLKLTHLKYLNFSLSGCFNITDQGISDIAHSLGENLPNLRHLTLNISFCKSLTDKGVIELANHLPRSLKQLQYLAIDFGDCTEITDHGVTQLATHIAHYQKGLQYLILDFEGCTKVSNTPKDLLRKTLDFIPQLKIN